jgi:aminoglycoside phosphotransferase (APT) family kinase protein
VTAGDDLAAPSPVPGLDLPQLGAWLSANIPGAGAALTAKVVAGGRSNLTYMVDDGSREWIVRRPPLGHVLATAHDMAREYRVLRALRDTSVPVPATYALCEDSRVIGAPFFVMQRVPGTPYRTAQELAALGPQRTRAIAVRLVDTLAALHQIDPASVGLGDFGRPDGYLGRQVARWKKQLDASYSRPLPAAVDLYARLAADVPTDSVAGIVHGDYRLDNVLVHHDQVAAVVDWEMATLGDPLSDLSLLIMYHRLAPLVGGGMVADASSAPGFLSETEIIERYTAITGRDVTHLGFYLGLSAYKLVAILEGIHYRFRQGKTVGAGFEHLGDSIEELLDAGLEAVNSTP